MAVVVLAFVLVALQLCHARLEICDSGLRHRRRRCRYEDCKHVFWLCRSSLITYMVLYTYPPPTYD